MSIDADLYRKFFPLLLFKIIETGKIDKSRLDDLDYVRSVVDENLDLVDDVRGQTNMCAGFLEAAEEAAEAKRTAVAVVLIVTVIEHQINYFYREVLEFYRKLSADEATEAIRSSSSQAKLGWLFHLSTRHTLPKELSTKLQQIIEIRNAFTHCKFPLFTIEDITESGLESHFSQIERMGGIDAVLSIPDELEEALDVVNFDLWPSLALVHKTMLAMYPDLASPAHPDGRVKTPRA